MDDYNDNYYDLNSFDDNRASFGKRGAAGQSDRRMSYAGKTDPARRRRRRRNRLAMVLSAVMIAAMLAVLIGVMMNGFSNKKTDFSGISTETKSDSGSSGSSADESENLLDTSYFATPEIDDDNSSCTADNGMYFWNKKGFQMFEGTDSDASAYAEKINSAAEALGSGYTIYNMIIPDNTEMGLPRRIKDSDSTASASQADYISAVYSALSENVKAINCYNYMAKHNSEYIYFNTDKYPTGLGGYYVYSAFADTLEKTAVSLDDCTARRIDDFVGSYSDYASNTEEMLEYDTVSYYMLPYDVTMDYYTSDTEKQTYDSPYYTDAQGGYYTYSVFLAGNNTETGRTVLKSDCSSAEGKIAVVKDGAANSAVVFLTGNYNEVHIIDCGGFDGNLGSYCSENGITEVLFVNGAASAASQSTLDSLQSLIDSEDSDDSDDDDSDSEDDSDDGYSDDGYSDDGYSDDGYSDDGYSDDGYSDDGYSDDGYSDDGYSDSGDYSDE